MVRSLPGTSTWTRSEPGNLKFGRDFLRARCLSRGEESGRRGCYVRRRLLSSCLFAGSRRVSAVHADFSRHGRAAISLLQRLIRSVTEEVFMPLEYRR